MEDKTIRLIEQLAAELMLILVRSGVNSSYAIVSPLWRQLSWSHFEKTGTDDSK